MNLEQPNFLKLLCATRFAEGLPNKHLQCLCRGARLVRLAAGQVLFREGETEPDVFVLTSGHVRLSMNVPGRGSVDFLSAGPGDLVGWSGLISDGRMTATATAKDDSTLIALSGQCLKEACEQDPQLGFVLMKRIAQVLSHRLLSTRLQLLDLFAEGTSA